MFCGKCGTANVDGAKFCAGCGASLAEEVVQNTYYNPEGVDSGYNQFSSYVPEQKESGKGLAVAGMVCGIISLFLFGIILGPLGIVFGAISKSKGYKGGMATAGIVCGAIGLILTVLLGAVISAIFSSVFSYM